MFDQVITLTVLYRDTHKVINWQFTVDSSEVIVIDPHDLGAGEHHNIMEEEVVIPTVSLFKLDSYIFVNNSTNIHRRPTKSFAMCFITLVMRKVSLRYILPE